MVSVGGERVEWQRGRRLGNKASRERAAALSERCWVLVIK